MLKICPKCKQSFECCVDDILKCHCVSVTIDVAILALLKEEYDDCLCSDCLKSLAIKTHNHLQSNFIN